MLDFVGKNFHYFNYKLKRPSFPLGRLILKFVSVRNMLETSVARLDKEKDEIDLFGHRGL